MIAYTATAAEVNTACDGIAATAAQINAVAVDGKQDNRWIIRGRTSADVHNVLRTGYLYIYDGTAANTIKYNFVAGFNTSTIGTEDNLAKG